MLCLPRTRLIVSFTQGDGRSIPAPDRTPIVDLPEFKDLDQTIIDFSASIPKEYKDPFRAKNVYSTQSYQTVLGTSVDPHLYALSVIPSMYVW
jgi:hypothetical protein